MYTQCPHCQTLFSVQAALLRAGRGTVRCGRCMESFDALDTLSDDLPGSAADIEAAGVDAPPAHLAGAGGAADAAGGEEDASANAEAEEGDTESVPGDRSRRRFDEPQRQRAALAGSAGGDRADAHEEPVPEIIREDVARLAAARSMAWQRWMFGGASLLLLFVLGAQYAWFHAGEVASRYPVALPWLETLCVRTGCVLPVRRDVDRIRLVSRDVRIHPKYEGALLLTAMLVNRAPYEQPFARMQFTLFNVNGQVIATRIFEPSEYLPADMNPKRGMPPDMPVQVSLELLALEEVAVSFEFQFL